MIVPSLKNCFITAFIIMSSWVHAQTNTLPNDCINAITICGDGVIHSNADGPGNPENGVNTCRSPNDLAFETNSIWLKINVTKTGTLGFTLRPDNKGIDVDYDFFVFGPTVSCNTLGNAIRCSTTNPKNAELSNNLTGMNSTSTDISEGPGSDGDSFVKSLDVTAGETYFIMIDRPHGHGGFNLEWNGSTTTNGSPFPLMAEANPIPDKKECTITGEFTFDLNHYASQLNSNSSNTVTFFASEGDASDNNNPIPAIQHLKNERKTIYAKVTNPNGCFDITDFDIAAHKIRKTSSYTLVQCDLDKNNSTDGVTHFNLLKALDYIRSDSEDEVLFFETINDRTHNKAIPNPENYSGHHDQIIYTKVSNSGECEDNSNETITLKIHSTTASLPKTASYFACEENAETATFNLKNIKEETYANLDVALFNTRENASLEIDEIISEKITTQTTTLFVRIEDNNECQDIETIDLIVNKKPTVIVPEPIPHLCLNNPSLPLTAENGFSSYEWSKLLDDGTEKTISIQQTVLITQPGKYLLEVGKTYNHSGTILECKNSSVFNVKTSNTATITDVLVEDVSTNNKITVLVEGEGDYEYAVNDPYGTYQNSNTFDNIPSGFIEVYVRDKNGCGTVNKTVSVIGYDKFFTPNGDGYNDYWRIHGTNGMFQAKSLVFIFDRYGKLIKQLSPSEKGWDGTFNGTPLPSSDYWFSVTLENGRNFKGHFSLKR